jgi:predicted dehydrogenase
MLLRKRTGGTLVKTTPHRTKLRIGIAGCGEVCELKHLPALKRVDGARVVAVAEVDPVRRARVADQFGIEYKFADVSALVASNTVDLVGVLAPPADHAAVAATALAAGAHVLVEKPLTLSLDAADALIAAARAASGRAFMGFHMRWHRLVRRAREAVKAGALGTPESIHATWNSPRGDDGTPDWKYRRHTGGGALIEIGVHIADLWRFILGTEARHVFAEVRHGRRDDEAASVTARLDGGVLATASISERAGHNMALDICGDSARVHVAAQRFDGFECYSTAESDGMPGPRIRGMRRTLRELPAGLAGMRTLGDYGDSYRGMWQHVVDAIHSGAPAECTLEDGREALRIVLAATASAESGRPVRIADAPGCIAIPKRGAET